jgi:LCP family protein required for cell wall assembly
MVSSAGNRAVNGRQGAAPRGRWMMGLMFLHTVRSRLHTNIVLLMIVALAVPAGGHTAQAQPADDSRSLTILVMGVDARPGAPIDFGVRADALHLLHLDPANQTCRLLSLPRDTRVELPGYGSTKINHALMVGGVPLQRQVVEDFLGLTIDRHALIDFDGFRQVVDAIGGVPLTVPEAIERNDRVLIKAGRQTLNSADALTYARFREEPSGDIGRIHRQWDLIRGLLTLGNQDDLTADVDQLLQALAGHIRTDLTAAEMVELMRIFRGVCTADSLGTDVLEGNRLRMHDPILRQSVYFNVVGTGEIETSVTQLLGISEH